MDLIASLTMLLGLDPRGTIGGEIIPLADAIRQTGPGYWLQALGIILILAGTLSLLFFSRDGTQRTRGPRAADPNASLRPANLRASRDAATTVLPQP